MSPSGSPRVPCEPRQLDVITPVGMQSCTCAVGAPDFGYQQGRLGIGKLHREGFLGCYSLRVLLPPTDVCSPGFVWSS